jgi:murein DD-endopeptidase MepM/ murein hydrolase activator NlpD
LDIILISRKDNKRLNLHLRIEFIILAALVLCVFLVVLIYNLTLFTSHNIDQRRLERLNRENKIVRREITKIEEEFSKLSVVMDSIKQYDKKLRTFASLEPINDDVRNMGIGGQSGDYDEELSKNVRGNLAHLSEALDELLARSKLQKQSFSELLSHVEEKKYLRKHTPSVIPVQGWFISGYGYRIDPFTGQIKMHEGLDIAAPPGTPIIAPADGVVKSVSKRKGFGLTLVIDHGYGYTTLYAHCQRTKVTTGTRVKRGDVIAYVGNTGKSTGPHLHYEVRVAQVSRNPIDYILATHTVAD